MTEAADLVDTLVEVDIRLVDDLVASRIEYLGELKRWIKYPWSRLERTKITMLDLQSQRVEESRVGPVDNLLEERDSHLLKQCHPTPHFGILLVTSCIGLRLAVE